MILAHVKPHRKRYIIGSILFVGMLALLLVGGWFVVGYSTEGRRYAQLENRFAELQESFNRITPLWWTSSACSKEHPLAATVCAVSLTRNEAAGVPKLLSIKDIPKYERAIQQIWPDAVTITNRDSNGFSFSIVGYPRDFVCAFRIVDDLGGVTGGVWCEGLAMRSHYRHVNDIEPLRIPQVVSE